MHIDKRIKKLNKLEEKNNDKLKSLIVLLLLSTNTLQDLYMNMFGWTTKVSNTLEDIHDDSAELADDDTADYTDNINEDVIIEPVDRSATSMALVSAAMSAIVLKTMEEDSYHKAVKEAIKNIEYKIDRTATNETFKAYNRQFLANLEGTVGLFRWCAQMDKRTCSKCSGLDGKTWNKADDIDMHPPLHINCRCIIEFEGM